MVSYFLLFGPAFTPQGVAEIQPLNYPAASPNDWPRSTLVLIAAPTNTALKLSQCRPASLVVLMTEKLANAGEYLDSAVQKWVNNHANNNANFNALNQDVLQNNGEGFISNVAQSKADWRRFAARHRHGGFLLFADGHVEWVAWVDAQLQPGERKKEARSFRAAGFI